MYKTKLGLKPMDNMAKKHPKFLKYLAYVGVAIGFLGMIAMCVILIQNFYSLVTKPAAVSGVMMVLPFEAEGVLYVPLFFWIISLFLLILVHEFSHGVIARLYKIKVKSSGIGFLNIFVPVIPLAFVELDEKELRKRPHIQQLSVFAAGSFSNIIFAAVVFLILLFVIAPIEKATFDHGIFIDEFVEGKNITFPAERSGMIENELIIYVDGTKINYTEDFIKVMSKKRAGESIFIVTNRSEYNITLAEHPENSSMGYLGIQVDQKRDVKKGVAEKYWDFFPGAFLWIAELFFWLYLLNLGIGLFNLVPLGPILDGGRMLQLLMHKFFKKKKGDIIWKIISLIFLGLVLINVLWRFIQNLGGFIIGFF